LRSLKETIKEQYSYWNW